MEVMSSPVGRFLPHPLRAVAAVGALVLLAACSSSGTSGSGSTASSSGGASPSGSAPATSASAPSTPASSAPASGASSGPSADLAPYALTASDVGAGYRAAPSNDTSENALPCTPNDPPLRQQFPPDKHYNVVITNAGQTVQISESLSVYNDPAKAAGAVAAAQKGFSCTSGTLGGQSITIKGSGQVKAGATPIDTGLGWDFATASLKGTAVAIRMGGKVIGLTFVASGTAGNGVDVQGIINAAAAHFAKAA